jgi:hypothetical protein
MVMKKFDLHEMQNKFHNSQDEIERIMLQREFFQYYDSLEKTEQSAMKQEINLFVDDFIVQKRKELLELA